MLIEPESVREIDAACIQSGIPGFRLMTAAGLAVAASALRHFPGARRFAVLAGPGNNGGDAHIAAGALKEAGAGVEVFRLASRRPSTDDAARALAECDVIAQSMDAYEPMEGDVVIDGVFGAGLSRGVLLELAALIAKVERLRIPIIAIDLPSGIDGRTGQILGAAFKADVTVTFMALKPGMLLLPGREHCGQVEIAEIGVPRRLIEAHKSNVHINGPEIWKDYERLHDASAHKYSRGALVVFSGGASHTGAARLTVNAGLRAGAGLVTIATPAEAMAVNATHLTAVMLREIDDIDDLNSWIEDKRLSTFVLGPGFGVGAKARDFVLALKDRKLVLDADGITSFKDDPGTLFDAFATGEPHLVLTPHEGEFSRLLVDIADDARLSKIDKAIAAAKRANAAVIYKGSDTVIASPDGRAAINTNAPPSLATAGSGDVLAGICGALLAQGYPVHEAACAAVWYHGDAANRAGAALTAETLVEQVRT
ncbi:NAD(P)H-hydrate dehydratase [Rhizobium sp. LjRoot254]|uniref:NAD(P)H-hydrate dehydratase n=1 Tax=Rhizobium sp. LjRoot254 TaxID=3342297 RepID=UPI003ECD638F